MTPKEIVLYQVRYYDPHQHRWMKSSWKMTTEDAKAIYGNRQYAIIDTTKEIMRLESSPALAHMSSPLPAA